MSNFASISTYASEIDKIIRYGGSSETSVSDAFAGLINAYARPRDLLLVRGIDYFNARRNRRVIPDGTLKNRLRIDYGFWESKDTGDKLGEEIAKKFDRGYPDSNILFEDSQTAVLYQESAQVTRAAFDDTTAFDELLTAYVSFEQPQIREFKQAVERFKADIPHIVAHLRGMIVAQGGTNAAFRQSRPDTR